MTDMGTPDGYAQARAERREAAAARRARISQTPSSLPEATAVPCNDCPWRRASAPGWLGPFTAAEWLEIAHSDQPIACHMTIRPELMGEDDWAQVGLRQCAGAAIYRNNVAKSPRPWADAAHQFGPDTARVFAEDREFLRHHTRDAS